MRYQGVYKIENLINGKVYIGSSNDVERRLYRHLNDLTKGIHSNGYLQNAFKKYGIECFLFEPIEKLSDSCFDNQFEHEQHYINEYHDKWCNCYNLSKFAVGSLGGVNGRATLTEEIVSDIKQDFFEGVSIDDIVVKYETTHKRVTNICNGVSWCHVRPELNSYIFLKRSRGTQSRIENAVEDFLSCHDSKFRVVARKHGVSVTTLTKYVKSDKRFAEYSLEKSQLLELKKSLAEEAKRKRSEVVGKGSRNSRATITENDVEKIKFMMLMGLPNKEISKITGLDTTKLSHIRALRTWVLVLPEYNNHLKFNDLGSVVIIGD